jgi:4-diphosphocytidyl-2-C-methyl-D-erythritol kinase
MTGPRDAGPLRLQAPAKVNLFLRVLGRRADGFHELVTVLQTVDLCDELELRLRPRRPGLPPGEPDVTLQLLAAPPDVPAGPDNLAVRAAAAVLREAGAAGDVGLDVALAKRIPAGGGLAGGSSDAAAVLRGSNQLLGRPLPGTTLARLAAALGSDVSFFLVGGTALCTGRGEVVEPIEPPAPFDVTLLMPAFGTSTAAVYAAWSRRAVSQPATAPPDTTGLRAALADADAATLQRLFVNDLQDAARAVEPRLAQLLDTTHLNLSGSGSTLFGYGRRTPRTGHTREATSICWTRTRAGNP